MKIYTLNEVQDKLIGKIGTSERDRFEYELQMDLIGKEIKQTRQEGKLNVRRQKVEPRSGGIILEK